MDSLFKQRIESASVVSLSLVLTQLLFQLGQLLLLTRQSLLLSTQILNLGQ